MELKREIYKKLLDWKSRASGKSALLIEGARRVGKSTIAKKLGQEEYKSYILIDFSIAPKVVRDNFLDNLSDLDTFFQILSLEYSTQLYERDSLIIFDEVQMFPPARQAIKHLVQDGRYDFIETGSLISIRENVRDIVIPSEEETIKMYPLTFQEFLIALDEEQLLEYIRDCYRKRTALEDRFHKRASRLIREYLLVGGMPQSITAYLENGKDFFASDRAKRQILELYRNDIQKISLRYRSKVGSIFESLPGFLSTHEKKVTLKTIDENGKFDRYDDPLFWLNDSMICNLCYRCSDPNVGLVLTQDNSAVKCYLSDTGLLVSLAFSENELTSMELYRKILAGRLTLNEGMLHENLIAQAITATGRKLFFYTHYSEPSHRNDIEIDFLLSAGNKTNPKVEPVEVKSSKNYTKTSLEKFKEHFGKRIGQAFVVHPKAFVMEPNEMKIPTYMWFAVLEEMN